MASKLILASFTSIALLKAVEADTAVPGCFHTCMVQSQTTDICSSNALSDLTACLTKLCVNPVDTQSLVAGLDVSINPKLEYSCKTSMVPSASDDGVTLALNGSCSNSPYLFKSFFPQGVGSITSSNGCKIELYSEEDCLGSAGSVDIGTSQTGQCIFHGGKSARVACSNELDAARAYIDKTCGTSSADSDMSSLAGYGPAPTSTSASETSSTDSLTWITLGTPSMNPSASPASASTGPANWTPLPTLTFPTSTPSPSSSIAAPLTGSATTSSSSSSDSLTWINLGTPSINPSASPASASTGPATWTPLPTLTFPTSTPSPSSSVAGPLTGSTSPSADTSIHTMTIPWIPISGTGSTSSMTITASPASESAWPPASWSSMYNATWTGNVTLTNGPTGTASSSAVLGTYTGVAVRVVEAGYAAMVGMGVAALL